MAGTQAQPPPRGAAPMHGAAAVPPPPAQPAAPVSSEAVSAVIRRAAELDTAPGTAAGRHLDEAQVLEIGREVGLSPEAIRRALAEHHAGLLTRAEQDERTIVGPRTLVIERTLPGRLATVGPRVDAILTGKVLECCRRTPSGSVWRPKEGLLAGVERGFRKLTRGRVLEGVSEITVELAELPDAAGQPAAVRVRLEVELRGVRRGLVTTTVGGLAVGGAGAATAVGASVALGDPMWLAGLPAAGALAAGSWWGSRASYRRQLDEVELILQGELDRAHPDLAPPAANPVTGAPWPRAR